MRSTLNRTITVAQRRWTRPAPTTVTRRLLGDLVSRSANRETMKTLKRLIAATGPASASTQEARLHPPVFYRAARLNLSARERMCSISSGGFRTSNSKPISAK